MIVARLVGGLGNQMFQYALGRRLAFEHRTRLLLDTSWFATGRSPGDTPRRLQIDSFRLQATVLPPSIGGPPQGLGRGDTFPFCVKRSQWPFAYLPQQTPRFEPDILLAPRNSYLDGFWQAERYFAAIASRLRSDFALKAPMSPGRRLLADQMRMGRSISVHVRRGDYVTNPAAAAHHGTCSPDWYVAAIGCIRRNVADAKFFVFSDDISWCRQNLAMPTDTVFIDPPGDESDAEDLILMSFCRHHVTANSSFSWWGAWLGFGENTIVVAPSRWTLDERDHTDLFPASWIRL